MLYFNKFIIKNMSNAEATKRLILTEAYKLFAIKPYDRVTVSDLEKATKLSRGAVFYHLPNKESLFIAVCDEFMLNYTSSFFKEEYLNFVEFIDDYIDWIESEKAKLKPFGIHNLNYTHVHLSNQALSHYPNFIEKAKVWQTNMMDLFYKHIEQDKRNGFLKNDIDLRFASSLFYNVYCGVSYNGIILPYGIDTQSLKKDFLYIYEFLKE